MAKNIPLMKLQVLILQLYSKYLSESVHFPTWIRTPCQLVNIAITYPRHRPPPAVNIIMFLLLKVSLAPVGWPQHCCVQLTHSLITFISPSYDGLLSKELDQYFLKSFCICCQQVAHAGPHFVLTPGHLASSWGTSLPSGWLQSLPAGGVYFPTLLPQGPAICFYFSAVRIPDLK